MLTDCGELVRSAAAGDEPAAPVDGVALIDGLVRVQQHVQQAAQVLWGPAGAVRVDVGRRAALVLPHEHLRRGAGHPDAGRWPPHWGG